MLKSSKHKVLPKSKDGNYGSIEETEIPSVDYSPHLPTSINFIPPSSITHEWKNDYQSMKEDFIYEQDCLSFENLITRMEE